MRAALGLGFGMPQGCRHCRWHVRASRSRLATQFRYGGMEQLASSHLPLSRRASDHIGPTFSPLRRPRGLDISPVTWGTGGTAQSVLIEAAPDFLGKTAPLFRTS